jgi:hypothetical protein
LVPVAVACVAAVAVAAAAAHGPSSSPALVGERWVVEAPVKVPASVELGPATVVVAP